MRNYSLHLVVISMLYLLVSCLFAFCFFAIYMLFHLTANLDNVHICQSLQIESKIIVSCLYAHTDPFSREAGYDFMPE
jgi:hypothetical protein